MPLLHARTSADLPEPTVNTPIRNSRALSTAVTVEQSTCAAAGMDVLPWGPPGAGAPAAGATSHPDSAPSLLSGVVPSPPRPSAWCTMSCQELNARLCDLLEAYRAPCTDGQAARVVERRASALAHQANDWNGEGSASELEALRRWGAKIRAVDCQQPWKSPSPRCNLTHPLAGWCRTLCLAGRRLAALDAPLQSLLLSSADTAVLGAARLHVYSGCTVALSCAHLSKVCRLQQQELLQVFRCSQLALGSGRVALEQASSQPTVESANLMVVVSGLLDNIIIIISQRRPACWCHPANVHFAWSRHCRPRRCWTGCEPRQPWSHCSCQVRELHSPEMVPAVALLPENRPGCTARQPLMPAACQMPQVAIGLRCWLVLRWPASW